jgi:hypothetical protein
MTREDVAIIQERRMSQQQQPPSELTYQNSVPQLARIPNAHIVFAGICPIGSDLLRTPVRDYFGPKFFPHDFFMDAWHCFKMINSKKSKIVRVDLEI